MKQSLFLFSAFIFHTMRLSGQITPPYPDNVIETNCYTTPQNIQWGIREKDSGPYTAHPLAQPFVGDIDNDGYPEIISAGSSNYYLSTSEVIIYDHQLSPKASIPTTAVMGYNGSFPIAIADVDHDGLAEIFVYSMHNGNLTCYNYDGNAVITKWVVNIPGNYNVDNFHAIPAIADINADGIPDIIVMDKVYNAQTGALEVVLPAKIGRYYTAEIFYAPVLADLDNDGILEAVGGNTAIKINITNANGTTGNSAFVWKQLSGGDARDGFTSVADIDLDGFLDVAVMTTEGFLYVWKPHTGSNSSPILLGKSSSSFSQGSIPVIADFNNDGYPEIAWSSNRSIQAYKYNPTTRNIERLWVQATNDNSGCTGLSAFDFNQDGKAEIIYRDETHLHIINGATGSRLASIPCESMTGIEYPVIADINGDGSAEIIVSESHSYNYLGRIRTFTSHNAANRWSAARPVWNQYAYNVVHINKDLTVPQYQFNPAGTFTDPTSPNRRRRPFNSFLQQAGYINQYGIPFIPLADAMILEDSIKVTDLCDSVRIEILVVNQGDANLNGNFKITVYIDRAQGEIIRTHTVTQTITPGSNYRVALTFTAAELASVSRLIFSVNDAGNGAGQNGGQQQECNLLNNNASTSFAPKFKIKTSGITCMGNILTLTIVNNDEGYPVDWQINGIDYRNQDTVRHTIGTTEPIDVMMVVQKQCPDTLYSKINVNIPPIVYLPGDTTICPGRQIVAISQNTDFYLWSDHSNQYYFYPRNEGNYTLIASNSCGKDTLEIHIRFFEPEKCGLYLYIPSAFTPNGDGINDLFLPQFNTPEQITAYRISIYDRWGSLVFSSHDLHQGWDGKLKGSFCLTGVYSYILEYTNETGKTFTQTGSLTLVR